MKGRYFSAIIRPSKFREDGRILEELEEKKEKKRITVLLTLLAILLAILVTIIIFCTNQSTNGSSQKATAIAKTSANLETVDKFYWFTRKNTYFTLTGKNDKGTEIVVIVPKSGEKSRS